MLGGKDPAAKTGGKLAGGVKGQLEGSTVGLKEDIGNDDVGAQLGMLAIVARVVVGADIKPGPAVKAALPDVSDEIGGKIVAEPVALVNRGPKRAGGRIDSDADGVAEAPGKNAQAGAVRIEFEDVGAVVFAGVVVGVVIVRGRANRDVQLFPVK
jgi:hypothetical protein